MPSGKSQPTATTQTVQNYSPEETARRLAVQDEAQRIYYANKDKMQGEYPGSKPVDMSQDTMQSLVYGRQAAADAAGFAKRTQDASTFGLGDVLDVNKNPYLQNAVNAAVRPITESYTDPGGVLATIRQAGRGVGQPGGTRQQLAEGVAAGRYAQAVGDTSAKIVNEAYGKGLDTYSRTLALAPSLQNMSLLAPSIYGAAGQTVEGYDQAKNDYAAGVRQWDMNKEWGPLANWASVIYGGSTPGSTVTQTGSLPKQNTFATAASGALSGAAMGAMIPGVGPLIGAGAGLLLGLFS